jgi:Arc/MetJ-type ribon-helix-helix transcriptional regulator
MSKGELRTLFMRPASIPKFSIIAFSHGGLLPLMRSFRDSCHQGGQRGAPREREALPRDRSDPERSFLPTKLKPSPYHPYGCSRDGEAWLRTYASSDPSQVEKITINLGYVDLGHIDLMVQDGFYSNRTDFIRTAIRSQLERHADVVKQSTARKSLDLDCGTIAARTSRRFVAPGRSWR